MTLNIPLCLRLRVVGGRLLPVIVSRLTNYLIKLITIIIVTGLLKTAPRVVYSLTPGSIAAPVTVRISGTAKKVPSLATTIIIMINLFKTIFNFGMLQMNRIKDPVTRNLSVNATARTMNASATVRVDKGCKTCTDLKLALGKVVATVFAPAVLELLNIVWRGDYCLYCV